MSERIDSIYVEDYKEILTARISRPPPCSRPETDAARGGVVAFGLGISISSETGRNCLLWLVLPQLRDWFPANE